MIYNNPFLIVEVSPAHNEMSVPVNNGIMIRFSSDMNANTVNNGTFLLRRVNGEAIESTVTYDRVSRRAYLKPVSILDKGTQYQFTVLGGDAGVKTATGTAMAESKRYEFTTTADILITAPKNLKVADSAGHLTLSWLQPDQFDTSKDLTYKVAVSTSNLDPESDPGAVVWPLAMDSIEDPVFTSIGVSRHLEPSTYYAYVRAYIGEDLGAWTQLQFVVEEPAVEGGSGGSTGGSGSFTFEVLETYPRANAVHILPDTIKVLFSSKLDIRTVTDQSVYVLKKKKPATLSLIDLLTDYSPSGGLSLTIDPISQGNLLSLTLDPSLLESNAEYTVILRESIKDMDGTVLGDTYFWSFNTIYSPLYGNPDLIRDDIKALLTNIPDKTLYSYMQNVSETALEIVKRTLGDDFVQEDFDAAVPRYVHEYVRVQASYDLLVNAVLEKSANSGSMRVLGELTIDSSRSNFVASTALAGFKERIKPWLDELHGHHNRGYAKPTTVVRGENVETYPDFFTRTELKDINE